MESTIAKYQSNGYNVIYVGLRDQIELPSIEDWLSYLKFADLVLTDSFHGCVFSILFKRPLIVFENQFGGYGRILSLLDILGLKETDLQSLDEEIYNKIEKKLCQIRLESVAFIQNSVS